MGQSTVLSTSHQLHNVALIHNQQHTLCSIKWECTSLGDLLGDDRSGVKGRVNTSDPLVLNKFLYKNNKQLYS